MNFSNGRLSGITNRDVAAPFIAARLRPLLQECEFGFAVACLASELQAESAPFPAPAHLDWQKLYEFLSAHRLAAHFYTLGVNHPGLWPDTFRDELRQDRYAYLLYGDRCILQVKQVLTAFVTAEIPLIVLKGWALISTLYRGDYGQRFCEDIDLLVPPGYIDRAEAVLRYEGFVGLPEVSPGYTRSVTNARAFTRVGESTFAMREFAIGLHWGLTHYPFFDERQVNTQELFERAQPLKVTGVDVLELSREDQLVYTCAHLALHHRSAETLMNYFEIAWILHRDDQEMDWQSVSSHAGAWHYGVQVQNSLQQVEMLWPGLIPMAALGIIQKTPTSWKEHWIDRLVEKTKGNGFLCALVELLAMSAIREKLSSMIRQVFPDKVYMQARYGDISSLKLLYWYGMRFMRGLRGVFLNIQD